MASKHITVDLTLDAMIDYIGETPVGLTLTEVGVRKLYAAAGVAAPVPTSRQLVETTAPHSAEVTFNAKGEPTFAVKVYAADENDAVARAAKAMGDLRQKVMK